MVTSAASVVATPAGPGYLMAVGLPAPGGHYSHAATGGGLLFISGQLPLDAEGHPRADLSFDEQLRLVLGNTAIVLREAGLAWCDVVKVTAYLAGVEHWPAFNRCYAQVLGDARPARSVVPVPALHHGVLVEIEAVAVLR